MAEPLRSRKKDIRKTTEGSKGQPRILLTSVLKGNIPLPGLREEKSIRLRDHYL